MLLRQVARKLRLAIFQALPIEDSLLCQLPWRYVKTTDFIVCQFLPIYLSI